MRNKQEQLKARPAILEFRVQALVTQAHHGNYGRNKADAKTATSRETLPWVNWSF